MRRPDDVYDQAAGRMELPPWRRPQLSLLEQVRRKVGATIVDNLFLQTARVTKLLPISHPKLHGVEVLRDIPYRDGGSTDHLLDVYRPEGAEGPLPVVLYIHGGGFRFLSKDTHWLFGLLFARRGYVVFNINYRLAPKHPYPAAITDACAAYEWVARNAHRYGGDLSRLVIAGESAGANLSTSVALSTSYARTEPWARAVFDTGVTPKAVFAACGILQVSDPERFLRRKRLAAWLHDRVAEVADAYFHQVELREHAELDLADPVCLLERGVKPDRPLPAFFAPCGTSDPLLDDTRRLARALEKLGVCCTARYYPGEIHAFHAMLFRKHARQCWRDLFRFLDEHVHRSGGSAVTAEAGAGVGR